MSENRWLSASYKSKNAFFCHDGNSVGLSKVSENRQPSATPSEVGFLYYGGRYGISIAVIESN